MKQKLVTVRSHIDAALASLPSDEDLDRIENPRHTDHDRHVFLPMKVARAFEAAKRDLRAAIDELDAITESTAQP